MRSATNQTTNMNRQALISYAAKTPEARKQEREAQLNRTLRDYQLAVGESAPDAEQELLWNHHREIEKMYNRFDEIIEEFHQMNELLAIPFTFDGYFSTVKL